MSLTTLLELVFGKTKKSKHLREKAESFLYLLRDKGQVSVKEAREFIGGTKTYLKIMYKLRKIGLINLTKNVDGDFSFSLSLDAYKFFVKKDLLENVENTLKKQ